MINKDPNHVHTYDAQGRMTCCSLEEKIDAKSGTPHIHKQDHDHEDEDGHDHDHSNSERPAWMQYAPAIVSFALLLTGILFEQVFKPAFFEGTIKLIWYLVAYIPVGLPVMIDAGKSIAKGAFFSEFFLMTIATVGAFFIGEYSEGVAVMVFYSVGELFQTLAVNRAKRSIKALLDIRPDTVNVMRDGKLKTVSPSEVQIDEVIQVKSGEKVALDGELISDSASFNTAALTGESKPDNKGKGEAVLAGMINLQSVSDIKVTALYKDSKLSKILEMVQDATSRKSQTQLFISKFAKVYTPIVVFLAVGICLLPYLFISDYQFKEWLYRSLVFLVISCPCALVISIPLGYFGGIGLASRNGILFKGSNYLDVMTKIDTVVMDKTGTLTKGVFKVQEVVSEGIEKEELVRLTASIESKSTHPIASAIVEYAGDSVKNAKIEAVEEISGHGLKGKIDGKEVLAGNLKLLKKFNIGFDSEIEKIVETIVVVAVDGNYAGYITIADEIKEDAQQAIKDLHTLQIKTVMLSGDKQSIVDRVAKVLSVDDAFGDLLPENKVEKVQALKDQKRTLAFVGDGVNDAPVIALADAGIAMGGLGSDATIETADIVIQNDEPSKIVTAIKIGRITKKIVWQNIILAMAVKAIVLALGAGGIATLWEAVFADVGVALLAILNAVRIQRMKL
ncbi:heavy metal translocating P-type ATPase [Fluviicola taffensis]|uniref:P-type Zn(2+) transporter n=1 Tax=Fluviicola taffensis (strain DSM 16823 / NCIMB 13979 / RW262) TaxID=755732 RepID=F2IEZ6_FLUTR|nr:heavy metal translocating P-type ATPase [Fluviicola taffensis]AEA42461.1 cadmium-translocating P-type ATPase [Fluviicola taffensis DSM 16823]